MLDRSARLTPAKLEAITLAVTRYQRQLEGDAWAPEPTLLGFEFAPAELVHVLPSKVEV